jgi:hypothetical protein
LLFIFFGFLLKAANGKFALGVGFFNYFIIECCSQNTNTDSAIAIP